MINCVETQTKTKRNESQKANCDRKKIPLIILILSNFVRDLFIQEKNDFFAEES